MSHQREAPPGSPTTGPSSDPLNPRTIRHRAPEVAPPCDGRADRRPETHSPRQKRAPAPPLFLEHAEGCPCPAIHPPPTPRAAAADPHTTPSGEDYPPARGIPRDRAPHAKPHRGSSPARGRESASAARGQVPHETSGHPQQFLRGPRARRRAGPAEAHARRKPGIAQEIRAPTPTGRRRQKAPPTQRVPADAAGTTKSTLATRRGEQKARPTPHTTPPQYRDRKRSLRRTKDGEETAGVRSQANPACGKPAPQTNAGSSLTTHSRKIGISV